MQYQRYEPTGGLDPLIQHVFFEILRERNRKGATVFLSSHVLSEIRRYCGRAAVLRDGSLIACDSVEALSRTNARSLRALSHDPQHLEEIMMKTGYGLGELSLILLSLEELDRVRPVSGGQYVKSG